MIPRVFYYLAQSTRTYRLPREELEERKRRLLTRNMRWAYDHVAFYHSCFKRLGKTPEDFTRPESLESFPTISKPQLVGRGADIRATGAKGEVIWRSTGTTGGSFTFEFSGRMNDVRAALALRRLTNFGVRPWSRIVSIWPPKVNWRYRFDREGRGRPSTSYLDIPFGSAFYRPFPTVRILVSNPQDLPYEVRTLRAMRPDFIVGRPSHLREVVLQLEREGLHIYPSGVVLTSEPPTYATLRKIAEGFRCPTCTAYGATEAGNLGGDCRAQRGIHLYEDFAIMEVLKDGESVGPGETGELTITTLYNDVMPLIRYRMGDLVKLADSGRCDCGSYLMRVESIKGRALDGLMTSSGTRVPPMDVANELEARTGFSDFQLVQESMSRIQIRLSHGQVPNP